MNKKIKFYALTILLVFVILFVISEITLRFMGFTPWKNHQGFSTRLVNTQPDSVLGWIKKPGVYSIPMDTSYSITVSYEGDFTRATSVNHSNMYNDTIAFFGGSITLGWAITDSSTFCWKLQKKLPDTKILNYGNAGYGTYQSLVMMERMINIGMKPTKAYYILYDDHEYRNVAWYNWMKYLTMYSSSGKIKIPYCTNHNNILVRHKPASYANWFLKDRSALVALLEETYMRLKTKKRSGEENRRKTTELLILEMNDLCKSHNTEFCVIGIMFDFGDVTRKYYSDLCRQNNIEYHNMELKISKEMRVPGDGHPNGLCNTIWANRIYNAIYEHKNNTINDTF